MERARRPEVSVIIPMYNEEANVKRTLDRVTAALNSFCNQWEIIAVDDGSVDKTKEVFKIINNISEGPTIFRRSCECGQQKRAGKF